MNNKERLTSLEKQLKELTKLERIIRNNEEDNLVEKIQSFVKNLSITSQANHTMELKIIKLCEMYRDSEMNLVCLAQEVLSEKLFLVRKIKEIKTEKKQFFKMFEILEENSEHCTAEGRNELIEITQKDQFYELYNEFELIKNFAAMILLTNANGIKLENQIVKSYLNTLKKHIL